MGRLTSSLVYAAKFVNSTVATGILHGDCSGGCLKWNIWISEFQECFCTCAVLPCTCKLLLKQFGIARPFFSLLFYFNSAYFCFLWLSAASFFFPPHSSIWNKESLLPFGSLNRCELCLLARHEWVKEELMLNLITIKQQLHVLLSWQ